MAKVSEIKLTPTSHTERIREQLRTLIAAAREGAESDQESVVLLARDACKKFVREVL